MLIILFFYSVRDGCKREGVKIGKKEALSCVKNVQQFFLLGKCFRGNQFLNISTQEVIKGGKRKVKKSMHEENIEKFIDSRCDEGATVISCDEVFAKELLTSISENYLLVDHEDINSKSFYKELGKLFLSESSFSLFMETSSLSNLGNARLKAILDAIKTLFDNRLRVILYGNGMPDIEGMSEKRFVSSDLKMQVQDEAVSSNEKLTNALKKREDAIKEKEGLVEELQEAFRAKYTSEENLSEALDKIRCLQNDLKNVTDEKDAANRDLCKSLVECEEATKKLEEVSRAKSKSVNELKESKVIEGKLRYRLQILEERNSLLENQITSSVKDYVEVWTQTEVDIVSEEGYVEVSTQTEVDIVSEEDYVEVSTQTEVDIVSEVATKTENKASQTTAVHVVSSSLNAIAINIEKQAGDKVEKVYRCIRNFASESKYILTPDGQFQCRVKVTKGKHVTDIKDLLEFEGYGETKPKAKEAAFSNYCDKIRAEAEKTSF